MPPRNSPRHQCRQGRTDEGLSTAPKRLNDLHVVNAMLRSLKLPQSAPGPHPAWDALKLTAFRTIRAVVEPLRSSQTMRRVLRRIALGKNANYYLKKA